MPSSSYRETIRNRVTTQPDLRYLQRFLENNRKANSACQNRSTLAHTAVVLDRINGEWIQRAQNLDCWTWEPAKGVDGQAIVLDYLDTETIEYLGRELELDPRLFQAHLAGCEQHHTGDWAPSEFTVAPYLQSLRRKSHFVTVDYRRPYSAPNDSSLAIFNDRRIQTCSVLRSHHLLGGANTLFEHERYSVAWFAGNKKRPGAVICICDPVVDVDDRRSLLEDTVAAIRNLARDQAFDASITSALHGSISSIVILWNEVAFHMDLQVSSLEDQLEHDFWDKPQNPVSILHRTQRAARRLTTYHGQLGSLKADLGIDPENAPAGMPATEKRAREDLVVDIQDIQGRLQVLLQRTDKAISALLASIAISEGVKASSLTAIALWFAPLSVSISFVSIDGGTQFGGPKYWIMVCIAVPLLLLVIAVANTSDSLMNELGKRRRGRALISLFKPDTRIGHYNA